MEKHITEALTRRLLEEACARWSIHPACVRLIRDYENFVYDAEIGQHQVVLRITHTGHRDRNALESELDFIRALAGVGIPVCLPVASTAGIDVEGIGEEFHACCFNRAPGLKTTWRDPRVWHERTFLSWGRLLAQLHSASEHLVLPSVRRRMQWHHDDVTSQDYLPPADHDIARRLAQMVQELRRQPTPRERYGLSHCDLHQGNFFSNERGELAVFDFDDACHHWYSYDLAVVFYHLPEGNAEQPPLPSRSLVMRHLLAGYRQVREVPVEYPDQVQRFLLMRDMQMYQSLFKKTLPGDRQPWWFTSAQKLAERIRCGRPFMEIPW